MPGPISFRRGEAGIAIVLLALGLYVVWAARAMPAGTLALPGPGFFPTALGILLAAVSVGILLRMGLRDAGKGEVQLLHKDIGIALAALGAVALAFMHAGAIATLGVFLVVLFRTLARIPWWKAVVGGAIGAALTWLVFIYLLGVQLPGA